MRHLALLVPCLALQLLGSCAPGSPAASGPLAPLTSRERAAGPKPADHKPTAQPADPNSTWMAAVNTRIRDASHQFFVDGADLRAEVLERGLTARFDHAGAHIASAHDDDDATPIALRTARVGRAAFATPIVAAAPALGDCQAGKADPEGHCIPRLEYASGGLTEWWEAGTQ